jgi:hypothetical protein
MIAAVFSRPLSTSTSSRIGARGSRIDGSVKLTAELEDPQGILLLRSDAEVPMFSGDIDRPIILVAEAENHSFDFDLTDDYTPVPGDYTRGVVERQLELPAGKVIFAAFFPSVTCSSTSSTLAPILNLAHSASSLNPLRILTSASPARLPESVNATRHARSSSCPADRSPCDFLRQILSFALRQCVSLDAIVRSFRARVVGAQGLRFASVPLSTPDR